jgi:hypothetical protein
MGLFESSCGVSCILAGFLDGPAAYALGAEAPYLLVAGLAALWVPILGWQLAARPSGVAPSDPAPARLRTSAASGVVENLPPSSPPRAARVSNDG